MATKTNLKVINEFIGNTWYGHGDSVGHSNNLSFANDVLYTYAAPLAKYDRKNTTMFVNMKRYSFTSSKHRNILLRELSHINGQCDKIVKVEGPFLVETLSH